MRILVLDSSGILPWRIRHALADAHEVIATGSLEEAERIAHSRHPDAVVVSVPHSSLPLRSLHEHCSGAHPAVPVLYETCLPGGLEALGLVSHKPGAPALRGATLLAKPASQCDLARALDSLLDDVRRVRGEAPQLSAAAPRGS